ARAGDPDAVLDASKAAAAGAAMPVGLRRAAWDTWWAHAYRSGGARVAPAGVGPPPTGPWNEPAEADLPARARHGLWLFARGANRAALDALEGYYRAGGRDAGALDALLALRRWWQGSEADIGYL